jgi:hypothetical protein
MVRAVAVVGLCMAVTGCARSPEPQAPQCNDQIRNGDETDVDCGGGGACRACAGGRTCRVADDCASGACDPIAMTCSALSVSFAPEVRYFSGFKPYAVVPADLDGNGSTDLAAINEYGSSVAVFRNDDGNGGAFTRVANPAGNPPDEPDNRALNFGPTGADPTGGGIADFNHDGHLDVVTADFHGDSVTILLNDGTGALNLRPPTSYRNPGRGRDLEPRGRGPQQGRQPGCGRDQPEHRLDQRVPGPRRRHARPGDQRGDAQLCRRQRLDPARVGDGHFDPAIALRFQAPADPGFTATTPYGIVVGDFNGDGKIDFATANAGSDDLAVRLNTSQKQ